MALRLPVDISWCVPAEIIATLNTDGNNPYTLVRIYRSTCESTGYELITDTVYVPGTSTVPFALDAVCANVSFNTALSSAEMLTFFDSLSMSSGEEIVLLTLGSTAPEKIIFTVLKDDTGAYKLLANNTLIYSTIAQSNIPFGWQGTTFTVSSLALNTTELVVTTVNVAINTIASNNVAFVPVNPYTKEEVISEIPAKSNGVWTTTWTDPTIDITAKDSYYYIVKYVYTDKSHESKFYLTIKSLTPKEQRLIHHLKNWLSPWMTNCLSDDDLRAGFLFAIQSLNVITPVTYFNIESLPANLESVALVGAAIFALMYKYLGIAFTDVSYSDSGVSMTIDRGGKIQNAIDKATTYYNSLINQAKYQFMPTGAGIGTIPMTISLGGRMSGSLLNVLNVFNAIGR